jgi:hypothetical protein
VVVGQIVEQVVFLVVRRIGRGAPVGVGVDVVHATLDLQPYLADVEPVQRGVPAHVEQPADRVGVGELEDRRGHGPWVEPPDRSDRRRRYPYFPETEGPHTSEPTNRCCPGDPRCRSGVTAVIRRGHGACR